MQKLAMAVITTAVLLGSVAVMGQTPKFDLGLNQAHWHQIQKNLTEKGYNPGKIDGFFGPNTREAIRKWQADQKAEATGYLTEDEMWELLPGSGEDPVLREIDAITISPEREAACIFALERGLFVPLGEYSPSKCACRQDDESDMWICMPIHR